MPDRIPPEGVNRSGRCSGRIERCRIERCWTNEDITVSRRCSLCKDVVTVWAESTIEDVSGSCFQIRRVDRNLVTRCLEFLLLLIGHGVACGSDSDLRLTGSPAPHSRVHYYYWYTELVSNAG